MLLWLSVRLCGVLDCRDLAGVHRISMYFSGSFACAKNFSCGPLRLFRSLEVLIIVCAKNLSLQHYLRCCEPMVAQNPAHVAMDGALEAPWTDRVSLEVKGSGKEGGGKRGVGLLGRGRGTMTLRSVVLYL